MLTLSQRVESYFTGKNSKQGHHCRSQAKNKSKLKVILITFCFDGIESTTVHERKEENVKFALRDIMGSSSDEKAKQKNQKKPSC